MSPIVHIARVSLALCLLPLATVANDIPGGGIDAERLAAHLRVLASDAFEGRAPTTPGEDKTVAYISEQFAAAGLQPAGDAGGWMQQVTLSRSTLTGPVQATLQAGGITRTLANSDDIAVESLHPDPRVDLHEVPLVFAGYGVTAPELSGQPAFEIFAESPSKFFLKVVDATLEFAPEGDIAETVTLRQGGAVLEFRRGLIAQPL
jgi:hypothetical protein